MFRNNLTSDTFKKQGSTFWKMIFIIIAVILLYLTLMPNLDVHSNYRNIDKFFHFIGFGAFAFVFSIAYPKIKYYLVATASTLLGIMIEIVQFFIPHRTYSYGDMLADLAGVLVALLFLKFIRFIFDKYSEQ